MADIIKFMPELEGEELATVAGIVREMTDEQALYFAQGYRGRRKSTGTAYLLLLLAVLGLAGINRFYLGSIALGIIYLLTWGFCGIGIVIDLFVTAGMVRKVNLRKASEMSMFVRSSFTSES